ncbi:YqaE/Pmp3 family membrane protein, partial [Phocaeicola plebeius]
LIGRTIFFDLKIILDTIGQFRIFSITFLQISKNDTEMSLIRVILSIIFPPLAVIDKGCGSVLIVFILTLCGWIPGVIGALIILNKQE